MNEKRLLAKRFNLYTIIAVYFLILVGGIVRTMEAGMGCPDWPKCFGHVVPPSSADQLPEGYEATYVAARLAKNERMAKVLNALGMNDLALQVTTDTTVHEPTYFDPTKAWVEYVNRLIGVLIGLLIIINMVLTFRLRNEVRGVAGLGVLSFVLVVFQGWIGSLVVSTNLLPGFITFHMLLAVVLVALLLLQYFRLNGAKRVLSARKWYLWLTILFLVQVMLGTQVREDIDRLNDMGWLRADWVAGLDWKFYIHRSFSLILTGLIAYVIWKGGSWRFTSGQWILVTVVLLEIALGIILTYFSMPSFAQPTHLLLGTVGFGVLFYLFLSSESERIKR